jgi:hypothetical protein
VRSFVDLQTLGAQLCGVSIQEKYKNEKECKRNKVRWDMKEGKKGKRRAQEEKEETTNISMRKL